MRHVRVNAALTLNPSLSLSFQPSLNTPWLVAIMRVPTSLIGDYVRGTL